MKFERMYGSNVWDPYRLFVIWMLKIVIRLSMFILLGLSAKNAKVVICSKLSVYSQSTLNEEGDFLNSVVFAGAVNLDHLE